MRALGRTDDELRKVELLTGVNKWAEGSCLVSFGDTRVLCTATVENKVPPFLRGKGEGWVTAEYGMLPRATDIRKDRDRTKIHPDGRTVEISRLIGRALREAVNTKVMGERQVFIDCDVLQADGGTRTAAITGGFVALHMAIEKTRFKINPLTNFISAISVGKVDGRVVLDLDYKEDSHAETDANFVMNDAGGLVELQATAENGTFSEDEFLTMLAFAKKGAAELNQLQRKVLGL